MKRVHRRTRAGVDYGTIRPTIAHHVILRRVIHRHVIQRQVDILPVTFGPPAPTTSQVVLAKGKRNDKEKRRRKR